VVGSSYGATPIGHEIWASEDQVQNL